MLCHAVLYLELAGQWQADASFWLQARPEQACSAEGASCGLQAKAEQARSAYMNTMHAYSTQAAPHMRLTLVQCQAA